MNSTANATIDADTLAVIVELFGELVVAANQVAEVIADEDSETEWGMVQLAEELGFELTSADVDALFDAAGEYRKSLAAAA